MKRTISGTFKNDPRFGGFIGWSRIERLLDTLDDRTLQIFLGLFSFGCRAKELRQVSENQIDLDYSKDLARVRNMYVSKLRKFGTRTFHLSKHEPSYKTLENMIEETPRGYPLFPFSYNQIYYSIAQVEAPELSKHARRDWTHYKGPWWPHRIRAERACQLIRDYSFSTFALKRWFGWATSEMPEFYAELTNEDVAALMVKPQQTLEITPQLLQELNPDQRDFIIQLLSEN